MDLDFSEEHGILRDMVRGVVAEHAPLEVVRAVRAMVPKGTPLGVRISASDWVEGGWDVGSTVVLDDEARKLIATRVATAGRHQPIQSTCGTLIRLIMFTRLIHRFRSASSKITGVWSEGLSSARGAVSTSAATSRSRRATGPSSRHRRSSSSMA